MKTLEVQLPEQTASKLVEAAERLSVSPEELLLLSIEEELAQLDAEFRASSDYVLKKNAELIAGSPKRRVRRDSPRIGRSEPGAGSH